MKTTFKIAEGLFKSIHADLTRPHRFAHERVGFVICRQTVVPGGTSFLAEAYQPVDDNDYLQNSLVGAMIGPGAFRKALQIAYNKKCSMFHIHRHDHHGRPKFSPVDLRESAKFMPNFWNVCPLFGHGAIVLSLNSAQGLVWDPVNRQRKPLDELSIIGLPMQTHGR